MPLIMPQVPIRGFSPVALSEASAVGLRVVIIRALWNDIIVSSLAMGCKNILEARGAASIDFLTVAGAFELPYAARLAAESGRFDAVVAIGCLFKGETSHFEYASEAVVRGLMDLNLRGSVPVINGVLHCFTEGQASSRAGLAEGSHNHGEDFALAAMQQVAVRKQLM